MAKYQGATFLTDDGSASVNVDFPNMPGAPDVAVAIHTASPQNGMVGAEPDSALARVIVSQPAVIGQEYRIVGRYNHSKVTRRYFGVVHGFAVGTGVIGHGLGEVPDMYYAGYADGLNTPSFAITGVDDTNFEVTNYGAAPFNCFVGCWLLHSHDIPRYTMPAASVTLPCGGGQVVVPHGLGIAPDLVLPSPEQAAIDPAPAGQAAVIDVDDTNITLENTMGAGNDLNVTLFAQLTNSIQA